jgi:hypothetical protein
MWSQPLPPSFAPKFAALAGARTMYSQPALFASGYGPITHNENDIKSGFLQVRPCFSFPICHFTHVLLPQDKSGLNRAPIALAAAKV